MAATEEDDPEEEMRARGERLGCFCVTATASTPSERLPRLNMRANSCVGTASERCEEVGCGVAETDESAICDAGKDSLVLRRAEAEAGELCRDIAVVVCDAGKVAVEDRARLASGAAFFDLPRDLFAGGGASGESGLRRKGLANIFASSSSRLRSAFCTLDPDETMRADLRPGVGVEEDGYAGASGVAWVSRDGVEASILVRIGRGVRLGEAMLALLLSSALSTVSLSESMELSEERLESEMALRSLLRDVA